MDSPPNPVVMLAVTYEYIFCLPSSEQLQPHAQRKARGATIGVLYPGYHKSLVTTQKSGYD
jgi:hypothetical protein